MLERDRAAIQLILQMEHKREIGSPDGLHFELEWTAETDPRTAADATRGRLSAWVGDELVWGRTGTNGHAPVDWTWVELLEFLSLSWRYLFFENGYPLNLRPLWPAELRSAAEDRWTGMPDSIVQNERQELDAFLETHDLKFALQGCNVPSIALVRFGELMLVGTNDTTANRTVDEIHATLSAIGDHICAKLAGYADERAKEASLDWMRREQIAAPERAEIISRWPIAELRAALPHSELGAFDSVDAAGRESLELAGMARGYLDAGGLNAVIKEIQAYPSKATDWLDALGDQAVKMLDSFARSKPSAQGQVAAKWARDQLALSSTFADVERIVRDFGVSIADVDLANAELDAIACWGPNYGPVILINKIEKHTRNEVRRSTLAHELCHLLIDRKGALPLGEVLNGDVPKYFEQRAEAFAAEFLLPQSVAKIAAESMSDTNLLVAQLTTDYKVSREIVAWQIRNSGTPLTFDRRIKLRSFVSHPHRF